jgi:ribosomal-protein-serine acetyltransferase
MDYAIDEMGIQRFVIGCAANNQRSRAVPERLGYRLHVTQPNGEVVGEFVYDRAIYGILSTAWHERRKANTETK